MGKPRLLILIRHGQSEGNKNRDIHQYIPDHRVKLTSDGWSQAEDAGRRLRDMLRKEDTIRIFTSPYRRTRETTEGILRTLTADDENGPSPFQRNDVNVLEEPRLREQDFGNFQPCSLEMERMWSERADYGHFFYRITNGESAADVYDRICGFNESLWRQFATDNFPSVCVLVTHGLMGRVFLMKWYKWTVEYFEDLRNIHHCEFLIMEQNEQSGSYDLKTKLRTWSEFNARRPPSPPKALKRWGGCPDGCNHHASHGKFKRTNTMELSSPIPAENMSKLSLNTNEPPELTVDSSNVISPSRVKSTMKFSATNLLHEYEVSPTREQRDPHGSNAHLSKSRKHSFNNGNGNGDVDDDDDDDDDEDGNLLQLTVRRKSKTWAQRTGRDGGGSYSGMPSPEELSESEEVTARTLESLRSAAHAHRRASSLREPLEVVQEHSVSDEYGDHAVYDTETKDERIEGTPLGDIY